MAEVITRQELREQELVSEQWYALVGSHQLGRKKPLHVKRLDKELVLWRDGEGVARCADADCPHRGANLGLGKVVDGQLQCPYHGFRFGAGGQCSLMPCEGSEARIPKTLCLNTHPLREAYGFLWFWYGEPREELPELPWIPEAPSDPGEPGVAFREMRWEVRFSRAMEGMLDLHHFPFAHSRYSPAGMTLLSPYEVRREEGRIYSRGRLCKEKEVDDESKGFWGDLNVAFPGMLHLKFSDSIQGVAVCTPIDTEGCWVAFRYHQTMIRVPVLRELFTFLLVELELRLIQPDDHEMLASTNPRSSHPKLNHFVRADKAIALWHKLRKEALEAQDQAAPLAASRPAAPLQA